MIFASGMLLLGCDQTQDHAKEQEFVQTNDQISDQADDSQQEITATQNKTELKMVMFFISFVMPLIYS